MKSKFSDLSSLNVNIFDRKLNEGHVKTLRHRHESFLQFFVIDRP